LVSNFGFKLWFQTYDHAFLRKAQKGNETVVPTPFFVLLYWCMRKQVYFKSTWRWVRSANPLFR